MKKILLVGMVTLFALLCVACNGGSYGMVQPNPEDLCKCLPIEPDILDFRHIAKHVPIPAIAAQEIGVDTILSWTQDAFVAPDAPRTGRELQVFSGRSDGPGTNLTAPLFKKGRIDKPAGCLDLRMELLGLHNHAAQSACPSGKRGKFRRVDPLEPQETCLVREGPHLSFAKGRLDLSHLAGTSRARFGGQALPHLFEAQRKLY